MEQQLGTLSGGQRRRIELARILFSNADTLDPRRADQPLGCRFHRMAARLLEEVRGRLPGHLPLHRTAGRSGEQGLASGRAARPDRHVFAWLEGLPAPARGGRGAPPPRTRSGREEGRPSHEARHSTARQGHQGRGGAEHDAPCRKAAGKHLRGAEGREGGGHPFPRARALRPHSDRWPRIFPRPTVPTSCSPA